jgi:hypothetical protein
MDKSTIAHELGHAICAEVQDGFWYPSSLDFERDENALAYCYCEKLDEKKTYVKGPYSRAKQVMNLGGIFGELLQGGEWSPWGARADLDEFVTANYKSKSKLKVELDEFLFQDDDELSFRACSSYPDQQSRRNFVLDHHDTCRRLPELWIAYLDFCDRISKDAFRDNVDDIAKNKETTIDGKNLKVMIQDIKL